jgi:hypothetical protein
MPFPSTERALQQALATKLRALDASHGSPWDNATGERARAAKEVAANYPLPFTQRRPWMVNPQPKGQVVGCAVVRIHDLIHPPVKRGLPEELGIFWRPEQERPKAHRVADALNELEEEAERDEEPEDASQ